MAGVVVPTMREKEDPLTTVMKGLSIAKDIYGIQAAQSAQEAEQAAAKERQAGVITPAEEAEYSAKFARVDPGTPGAFVRYIKGKNGALSAVAFATKPEKPKEQDTIAITTVDAKGNKVTKLVPKVAGGEYPVYIDPSEKNKLPKTTELMANKLADDVVKKYSIANTLAKSLDRFRKAESEDQKIQAGNEMLKAINSDFGGDAIGAEEAKRLGAFLEKKINIWGSQPGSMFGRDLEEFDQAVYSRIGALNNQATSTQEQLDKLLAGGKIEPVEIEPPAKKLGEGVAIGAGVKKNLQGLDFDKMSPEELQKHYNELTNGRGR